MPFPLLIQRSGRNREGCIGLGSIDSAFAEAPVLNPVHKHGTLTAIAVAAAVADNPSAVGASADHRMYLSTADNFDYGHLAGLEKRPLGRRRSM